MEKVKALRPASRGQDMVGNLLIYWGGGGGGGGISAAAIWSPGRQSRPMNPPGDPRSYHRWSVWRPMDALGFAKKNWEWKCRDDSTDALISNVNCSLVKCRPRLVHFDHFFWLVAWFQQIIGWRTTQNWDGPPNQQPHGWSVRRARILQFLQHWGIHWHTWAVLQKMVTGVCQDHRTPSAGVRLL